MKQLAKELVPTHRVGDCPLPLLIELPTRCFCKLASETLWDATNPLTLPRGPSHTGPIPSGPGLSGKKPVDARRLLQVVCRLPGHAHLPPSPAEAFDCSGDLLRKIMQVVVAWP
jgi:hypothetical protein